MKPEHYRYCCFACGTKARHGKPLTEPQPLSSKRICDCCEEYGDAYPVRAFGYPWEPTKKEDWSHST